MSQANPPAKPPTSECNSRDPLSWPLGLQVAWQPPDGETVTSTECNAWVQLSWPLGLQVARQPPDGETVDTSTVANTVAT